MSGEEYREVHNNYFNAVVDLGKIENKLRSLAVMIDTLCIGLQQENVKLEVIDCLKCVGATVRDIQDMAEEKLLENLQCVDMSMIATEEA